MKKSMLKIAVLSVSMIVGTIAAINGNISEIAKSFPNVPISTVELISTIPSLFLIVSVLSSSFIAQKIGMKKTVLIGILLAAGFGIVPFFVSNIYVILLSRACLGFGTGLFNSLLVSFISSLFDGEERTAMIGRHQAMGAGGGIVVTFISGQLLKYGWQYSFLAYGIGFISFVLFMTFVPDIKPTETKKESDASGSNSILSLIPYLILIFVTAVFYMTFGIKISLLVSEVGYGSSAVGSYVIMALCAGSLLSGFMFAQFLNIFKNKILVFGFAILSLAMFLLSISHSTILTIFAGFLAGFGNASTMPFVLNRINSSNMKNPAIASSLVYVAYNLGSALSPYGALLIQSVTPLANMTGLFMTLAILWLFCSFLILITQRKQAVES